MAKGPASNGRADDSDDSCWGDTGPRTGERDNARADEAEGTSAAAQERTSAGESMSWGSGRGVHSTCAGVEVAVAA